MNEGRNDIPICSICGAVMFPYSSHHTGREKWECSKINEHFKEAPLAQLIKNGRASGYGLVRDTAEERLFNALKALIYCHPMTSEDFRQYAQNIAETALDEWADLRSPELNCHGLESTDD